MDWQIIVGQYQLALLASVEIHKSVDILAKACTITLPLYAYNSPTRVNKKRPEELLRRGDAVTVALGYNGQLVEEFKGYLLSVTTDDDDLKLVCEDELFLLRKPVANKQFKGTGVKAIADYLIQQTGVGLQVNCTLTIDYDKFVINNATAYDVLKKLQEETKGNIYIRDGVLNLHPPYIENHGQVAYDFEINIEEASLKYIRAEDKKIEVVVENVGLDGKKKEVVAGTTGGDRITIKGNGLSQKGMQALADAEYRRNLFDGYEGDITGWLIPYCEPGMSARITDADFEYKNGWYYVKSVTTTFDSNGGSRKIQLGIKVGNG